MRINYNLLDKSNDIEILLDRIGESQFVLLGEASHGTSEFYRWRSEISKLLIQKKGFSFIAVEGDWPDCYKINKYIKEFSESGQSAYDVLHSFNRWPTWMWANNEMVDLVEWLKKYNDGINVHKQNKVGFYGLDLYSLWESMEEIIQYLTKVDPLTLKDAIKAYNCFEPYNKEVEAYARATAFVPKNCEEEVIEMLTALRKKYAVYGKKDHQNKEEYFNAEQNAITTKDAEKYYRTMMRGDVNSWNLRDTHMMDTLERLMDFHSQNNINSIKPKAIVWAHNTHIGDARFTDMALSGMINIGQLVREKKGIQNTVLVGFSTYNGTVIAAEEWGSKMEIMNVPPAREGSWDNLLQNLNNDSNNIKKDKIIIFERDDNTAAKIASKENNYMNDDDDERYENRDQRAIGVVYRPNYEKYTNYVPTILSLRYDALLYIDNTNALYPLHIKLMKDKNLPETFPRGE
jgi:erythromycin esterase